MTSPGRGTRTLSRSLAAVRSAADVLTRPDGHGRAALVAYGALSTVDLLATARAPRGAGRAAKPLLMPALATYVSRRRERGQPLPKRLTVGLGCATAGDAALLADEHESAFLLGMAAFLGTQVSYTAGLAGLGGFRGLRARPRTAVGALAGWAVVNAALAPALERRLRLPVAGYSLAIAAMGVTALGVGGDVAVGATSFLASDLLIGLQAAGVQFPTQEVLVMAGYILGQYLLVTGWLDRLEAAETAEAAT